MAQQKHIIKRQVIEVEVPSHLNNVDVQDRVAQLYNQRIIFLIDKFLTEKDLAGYGGRIDHLELDLGTIDIKNLEGLFLDKVESELKNKLSGIKLKSDTFNEKAATKGDENSDLNLVVYFLKTGSFPWWAQEVSYDFLEKALANVIEKNASLIGRLFRDESILKRFIFAFHDNALQKYVAAFLASGTALLNELQSEMISLFPSNIKTDQFRERWWYSLIKICLGETSQPRIYDAKMVINGLATLFDNKDDEEDLRWLSYNSKLLGILNKIFNLELQSISYGDISKVENQVSEIQQFLSKGIDDAPAGMNKSELLTLKHYFNDLSNSLSLLENEGWVGKKSVTLQFDQLVNSLFEIRESLYKVAGQAADLNNIEKHLELAQNTLATISEERLISSLNGQDKLTSKVRLTETVNDKRSDVFSNSDKLYIQNSGLVLLWPFLNRFFINIGLANDKAFADGSAAEKACLILQYLTEGNGENIFEAQLPLNKILCGIDLHQTVNTQWAISKEEDEACNNFLSAVIENGGSLWKNLSVNGFRQAYLRREGALSTRDGHWLLQVKREGYDVIIDQLPWTIGVVKLPWMENLIFVEWQRL